MHQQGGLIDSTAGQKLEDLSGKLLVERFLFVAPGIAARLMNCQHLGGGEDGACLCECKRIHDKITKI